MTGKVYGLIAGSGDLPSRVIDQLHQKGEKVCAIAFEGQTNPDSLKNCDHLWVKLGAAGPILDYFESQGVTHIVLAGAIRRPSLSELSLDWTATKILAKIGYRSLGDDGLLSAIVGVLESKGYTVVAAHELLQDVSVSKGVLTKVSPISEDMQDIERGIDILIKLGEADIGQATVIQQGLVLGVEAIEGTAKLIERVAEYHRPGRRGILIKMAKPNQNLKVDLPTIGPDTILKMVSSGLIGVALEAGRCQILNREETLSLADKHGLFVFGF